MTRILISGASGLLGGNLAHDYAERHEVWGVFHEHSLSMPGVSMIGANLSLKDSAQMVLGKVKPQLVIHCAAATDVDRCQREPEWANRLNCEMAEHVAGAARRVGARLIHISTDAVFDGRAGGYTERDKAAPINVYGQTKLEGEGRVLAANPGALVVRTNLFGWNVQGGKSGLAGWFLGHLAAGRSCAGFDDVFFSPIHVRHLGEILLELARAEAQDVLHVGGATCLTKYEFGRALAREFGFDESLIERASVEGVGLHAPRPKRICLDSDRARALLGHEMPELDSGLAQLRDQRQRTPSADSVGEHNLQRTSEGPQHGS